MGRAIRDFSITSLGILKSKMKDWILDIKTTNKRFLINMKSYYQTTKNENHAKNL